MCPGYGGTSAAKLLSENAQAFLFMQETVAAGQASVAFQLRRERGAAYPFGASFQLQFSATPGAFQIDIQMADNDVDADFVTMNSITGGLNAGFFTRLELPSFWAKYVRAKVVTLTNAVQTTLQVTR